MNKLRDWETLDKNHCLHVLSLGAGRQSSVMYLMADAGEIKHRPDYAIFADTGDEPAWVYEQLEYLKSSGTIPIIVVSNGNIYKDTIGALHNPDNNNWGARRWVGPPAFSDGGGPIKRKCTQHYKIKPKEDEIRRLLKNHKKKYVVDWRGHTTDEIHRAKPDKRKYYKVRWPLLEHRMSDAECAAWARRNNHPEFKWSACIICPFRLRQWERAKELMSNAEMAEKIKSVDAGIRDLSGFGLDKKHYLNADYKSMDEFIKNDYRSRQMSFFDCDGGLCGL